MNNLELNKTMSSREIAELTNKEHKNVLADCDKLNDSYNNMGMAEISAVNYKADNGQTYREYILTKMQTFDLMTGYKIELRIKVNRRWEELETKQAVSPFQIPQTFADALKLAAKQAEENEKLQLQIEEQKPAVTFRDSVSRSGTNISIGDMAKLLN